MPHVSAFQQSKSFAVQRVLLAVMGCLLPVASATAQPHRVATAQTTVTVTPATAMSGTPRKISIESSWRNGSPPSSADAVSDPSAEAPVLVIRLKINSHGKVCAKGGTPFKQELIFTPFKDGEMPVYVLTSNGGFVAQSKIISEPVFDF